MLIEYDWACEACGRVRPCALVPTADGQQTIALCDECRPKHERKDAELKT